MIARNSSSNKFLHPIQEFLHPVYCKRISNRTAPWRQYLSRTHTGNFQTEDHPVGYPRPLGSLQGAQVTSIRTPRKRSKGAAARQAARPQGWLRYRPFALSWILFDEISAPIFN
jgi:hypothetical protein